MIYGTTVGKPGVQTNLIDMFNKYVYFSWTKSNNYLVCFLLNHNTYRYRDMKICTLFTIYTDRSKQEVNRESTHLY
jgi:hypothetical protein